MNTPNPPLTVRVRTSGELTTVERASLRTLMDAAFAGRFDDTDWEHALGGLHAVAELGGVIVAHAAAVGRTLYIDRVPLAAAYVEAVATHPHARGRGFGTAVMRALEPEIQRIGFGALSTDVHGFYERLGWRRWEGPTFVRGRTGFHRSPEEDDGIMVRIVPGGPEPLLTAALACENRTGDAW